jgi:hypothetical protein
MFIMSILFIIAVIVEVTAQSFWQIIIGILILCSRWYIANLSRPLPQLHSYGYGWGIGSCLSI